MRTRMFSYVVRIIVLLLVLITSSSRQGTKASSQCTVIVMILHKVLISEVYFHIWIWRYGCTIMAIYLYGTIYGHICMAIMEMAI